MRPRVVAKDNDFDLAIPNNFEKLTSLSSETTIFSLTFYDWDFSLVNYHLLEIDGSKSNC